jgi:preprotein translocase subunit Sec61beta
MAKDSGSVNMPGAFGGLMRYSDEYESKFYLKPTHVIVFIILIVIFRIGLGVFFK